MKRFTQFFTKFINSLICLLTCTTFAFGNEIYSIPSIRFEDQTNSGSIYINWSQQGDGFLPSRVWKCEYALHKNESLFPEFIVEEENFVQILVNNDYMLSYFEVIRNDTTVFFRADNPNAKDIGVYTPFTESLNLPEGKYRIRLINNYGNRYPNTGKIHIYFKSSDQSSISIDTTQYILSDSKPLKYSGEVRLLDGLIPEKHKYLVVRSYQNQMRIRFSTDPENRVNAYLVKVGDENYDISKDIDLSQLGYNERIPLTINAHKAEAIIYNVDPGYYKVDFDMLDYSDLNINYTVEATDLYTKKELINTIFLLVIGIFIFIFSIYIRKKERAEKIALFNVNPVINKSIEWMAWISLILLFIDETHLALIELGYSPQSNLLEPLTNLMAMPSVAVVISISSIIILFIASKESLANLKIVKDGPSRKILIPIIIVILYYLLIQVKGLVWYDLDQVGSFIIIILLITQFILVSASIIILLSAGIMQDRPLRSKGGKSINAHYNQYNLVASFSIFLALSETIITRSLLILKAISFVRNKRKKGRSGKQYSASFTNFRIFDHRVKSFSFRSYFFIDYTILTVLEMLIFWGFFISPLPPTESFYDYPALLSFIFTIPITFFLLVLFFNKTENYLWSITAIIIHILCFYILPISVPYIFHNNLHVLADISANIYQPQVLPLLLLVFHIFIALTFGLTIFNRINYDDFMTLKGIKNIFLLRMIISPLFILIIASLLIISFIDFRNLVSFHFYLLTKNYADLFNLSAFTAFCIYMIYVIWSGLKTEFKFWYDKASKKRNWNDLKDQIESQRYFRIAGFIDKKIKLKQSLIFRSIYYLLFLGFMTLIFLLIYEISTSQEDWVVFTDSYRLSSIYEPGKELRQVVYKDNYIVNFPDGKIKCYDYIKGNLKWQINLESSQISKHTWETSFIDNELLIYNDRQGNDAHILDINTGKVVKTFKNSLVFDANNRMMLCKDSAYFTIDLQADTIYYLDITADKIRYFEYPFCVYEDEEGETKIYDMLLNLNYTHQIFNEYDKLEYFRWEKLKLLIVPFNYHKGLLNLPLNPGKLYWYDLSTHTLESMNIPKWIINKGNIRIKNKVSLIDTKLTYSRTYNIGDESDYYEKTHTDKFCRDYLIIDFRTKEISPSKVSPIIASLDYSNYVHRLRYYNKNDSICFDIDDQKREMFIGNFNLKGNFLYYILFNESENSVWGGVGKLYCINTENQDTYTIDGVTAVFEKDNKLYYTGLRSGYFDLRSCEERVFYKKGPLTKVLYDHYRNILIHKYKAILHDGFNAYKINSID